MAAGLAVIKEPGTDPFAKRFAEAGFSVLAFDYRRLGESGGHPRQITHMDEQHQDWDAAIRFAGALPGVDPDRIAVWGFSVSGGHIFHVAASNPHVAAAIAHSPVADGQSAMRNALRHTTPLALTRLTLTGLLDWLGGLVGRKPLLVPLAGGRGAVASLTTPDAQNGARALNPDNKYPFWRQEIAARSALRVGFYRPGRHARSIECPLLVLAYDDDGVTPPAALVRAGQRAPRGEVVRLPGGHYEAFMGGHEAAADVLLSFLRHHLQTGAETDEPPDARSELRVGG
jgi:pimeloyl-ACP methyl ester carboxylesterase